MINSDFKDADGFRLQFEESVPDDERKYYMKTFPRVDDVSRDRVHCTTCDCHVGTAPISEKIIRTHQILNVTQCNKCFAFYNSGEFGKGEDGSEYYCRWCGQGGEVFCCSSCPFVFCNKCIKDNLTDKYVKEIEDNDDWSCFVCNKEILKRMRAQHWALRNFMNKQLEKIQKVNINSEEELNNLLNDDLTNCCPKKKRKLPLPKPTPAPMKRPLPNGMLAMAQPPPKRPTLISPVNKQIKIPVHPSFHQPRPGPRTIGPKRSQSEVVCTPDIMGLFNEQAGGSSATTAPPPLAMRQIQRPGAPRAQVPNPIYHTVNGYQIDLNQASRQEIFRLPNGKLIQVRKQTNPTPAAPRANVPAVPTVSSLTGMMPRGTQFSIRSSTPLQNMTTQSRMMRPQAQLMPRVRAPNQARFSFSDDRLVSAGQQSTSNATAPATSNASTIFTQQNGSISVARAPQPDTPFGKSKTAFEDRIIQGLEICQHTINKMITLTNSTSFKTSRSFADLKDLYIHLQYLFTYTSGKFKTLQDGLVTGMEDLVKNDDSLKEKNNEVDDDFEIVQQKVDVIEVMSDDDEPPEKAPEKSEPSKVDAEKATEKVEGAEETMEVEPDLPTAFLETLLETPPSTVTQSVMSQAELLASLNVEIDDEKILKRTAVKVERLEDSKNSVIKQYLIAIQQRRDAEVDEEESEEEMADLDGSFEMPLVPEVVMEENPDEEGETSKTPAENETDTPEESTDKPMEESVTAAEEEDITDELEETEKVTSAENLEISADLVEIASDEEESVPKLPEVSSISISEAENITNIDSTLPTDLLADESIAESIDESGVENIDDSIQEVAENGDKDHIVPEDEDDSVIPISSGDSIDETMDEENPIKENGTNHSENGASEEVFDNSHSKTDKKGGEIENESTTIDDEKDLLDTLINSLDEPLAPMDVEIPEALG